MKHSAENPANPFAATSCEWLEAPPIAVRQVVEERAKSLLTRNDSPDIPFRWSVNPYRGCTHGCDYCYARRTHEYLDLGAGTDFETHIVAKINAPELLRKELQRPRWRREQIAFSGVTDCYQALEGQYRLTRGCLEACAEVANPVGIVTKSPLVLRDLDVLAEINRQSRVSVWFSIAFADDALARQIERGAPPPSRRFDAVRQLQAAGLAVGVILAPIIPGLNDRDIPTLLERAAACGATSVSYQPVRLPGSVADVFLTRLRRALPAAAARVEARIREMHDGRLNNPQFCRRMAGSGPYWESVERLFETTATRLGLNDGQRDEDETWTEPQRDEKPAPPRQGLLFESGL